jgi:nucleotide-binding universal stress UspA family protein
METNPQRPKVVVGVDGSPESDAALRVAYEEARARQAELVVVHAWAFRPLGPSGDDRGQAEDELAASVERLRQAAEPEVPVVEKLVGGDPRQALMHEAADAALLVVGSRGLGRVSAVVLGSVSRYLLHHAPCPVEIVPPLERVGAP